MRKTFAILIAAGCLGLGSQAAVAGPDGAKIFKQRCAMCHAIDRKKFGPAVKGMGTDIAALTEKVESKRRNGAMRSAVGKLSPEDIKAVVAFLVSQQK